MSSTLIGFGFEPQRDFPTSRCQVPVKLAFSAAQTTPASERSAGPIHDMTLMAELLAVPLPLLCEERAPSLQDRYISAPRAGGFRVLLRHDPRDLGDVRHIVDHPGRQHLAQGNPAELRMRARGIQ